jgi:hypothetical protein
MAKQTINIGAAPNDGTGTPLRTSFDYTNQNFTELYTSLGGGTGLPGAVTQVLFNNGTNVAGDAGMTYNSTTDVLSVGGVTASGNVSVAGTFSARNGENASSVRAAASDYAAVAFDGATASTRVSSTLTGQALGTGDFSLWARFRVPASVSATGVGANPGIIWLSPASVGTYAANTIGIYLDSTGGVFRVFRYGTTQATDNRIASVASFIANYAGQVVDAVVTRAGNTLKIYINGTDTAYTETTGGAAPAWGQTVVSDFVQVGAQSSNNVFTGRIYRSVVFNRALSQSDVTELISTGVNPADQWGTKTQLMNTTTNNGGFETAGGGGADVFASWGEFSAGTAVISRDTIDYSPDLSSTASAKILGVDGTALATLNAASVGTLAPSKRYRLSAAHKTGASNNVPWSGGTTNTALVTFATTTSWANYSAEFVMPVSDTIKFTQSGATTIWADNVILERIGAIVDLDFTVGTGYQTYDRSTNNLHGTMFGGVEFVMPRRAAVLYATTNTSGNQQMLATTAIPTTAIIEDIIVNSTGSCTVSVGNASAGTQLVNAAAVVSGRQKLTLATPFSSTGNLWVNSSTTATLQFTILYTIAL